MKSLGIIGFGKFGQLVKSIFESKCPSLNIYVYDSQIIELANDENLKNVISSNIIIPAVPISALENTVNILSKNITSNQIIIDVSSVKVFSKEVFLNISEKAQVLLTHPMFGPGTLSKRNKDFIDLNDLNICIENISVNKENYQKIINFLKDQQIAIHYLDAHQHDKLTASFQFTSLFFASLLKEFDFKESKIDTISYKKLLEFIEHVSADKYLTKEFYRYNPYCKDQLNTIKTNFDKIYSFCESKT